MTEDHTVGASEAGRRFSEFLARAERGEEIVITRDGKPVAKLTRAEAPEQESDGAALQRLKTLHERLRAEGVSFPTREILADRDEGRR
jgi:prevent-host-death family protein